MSVVILPMVLEVSRLFGGFFVSPSNMPVYFKWLQALSYCDYTYVVSLTLLVAHGTRRGRKPHYALGRGLKKGLLCESDPIPCAWQANQTTHPLPAPPSLYCHRASL